MGSHNMTKYLWIPLYMVSEYAVVKSLLVASGVRFIIAYLITTGLSIVPSPLIEPRYYVVPCAIFIKAIADHSDCQKLAAYYLVVDVILLLLLSGIFGQRQIW